MYHENVMKVLREFPIKVPKKLPTRMQLLDCYRCQNKNKLFPLDKVDVLLIQHHLGPLILRLYALKKDGLKGKNTWLIDIPYSTNKKVKEEIEKKYKIPHLQISPPLRDPIAPYSVLQMFRVESIIHQIAAKKDLKRLLVIDDGAYFVRALHNIENYEKGFARTFRGKVAIVEQTTRGHRYLETNKYKSFVEYVLKAPVVSVARCKTKRKIEAPFIGEAAVQALLKSLGIRLKNNNISLNRFNRIAIIGYGSIGQAVLKGLNKNGYNKPVYVIEKNTKKHEGIKREGGRASCNLPQSLKFDLVIGCTGKTSFNIKDWKYLSKNAYLVSASSAAVEFNRRKFVDLAELYPDDDIIIEKKQNIKREGFRASIKILDKKSKKRVTFIQGTWPINFDGEIEHLPIKCIQPTHTLLYAAAHQALNAMKPGLKKIDPKTDETIRDMALEELLKD